MQLQTYHPKYPRNSVHRGLCMYYVATWAVFEQYEAALVDLSFHCYRWFAVWSCRSACEDVTNTLSGGCRFCGKLVAALPCMGKCTGFPLGYNVSGIAGFAVTMLSKQLTHSFALGWLLVYQMGTRKKWRVCHRPLDYWAASGKRCLSKKSGFYWIGTLYDSFPKWGVPITDPKSRTSTIRTPDLQKEPYGWLSKLWSPFGSLKY